MELNLHKASPANPDVTRRALFGVCGAFLINGTIVGSLSGHFASLKERLGADPAEFSIVVASMAVGTIVALSFGGKPVQRWGSKPVLVLSGVATALLFIAPAFATSLLPAALALLALGMSNGLMDISMNVHASTVERRWGRLVMTRIHSLFSIGGILGAFTTGLSLDRHAPASHAAALALVMIAFLLVMQISLLPADADRGAKGRRLALPRLSLLPIALLAFLVLFCTAAVRDWSAIYLSQDLRTDYSTAGLGFAIFSAAMAAGRLFGDHLRASLGPLAMLVAGGVAGAAALAIGLALQTPAAAIAALGLMGLAHSGLTPLLFSTAGREPHGDPAANISAVMTVGFLGYLAGPPLIGMIADQSSLRIGLLSAAAASAAIAVLALTTAPKASRD